MIIEFQDALLSYFCPVIVSNNFCGELFFNHYFECAEFCVSYTFLLTEHLFQ